MILHDTQQQGKVDVVPTNERLSGVWSDYIEDIMLERWNTDYDALTCIVFLLVYKDFVG